MLSLNVSAVRKATCQQFHHTSVMHMRVHEYVYVIGEADIAEKGGADGVVMCTCQCHVTCAFYFVGLT